MSGRVFGFGGPSPGRTISPNGAGTATLISRPGRRYTAAYDADGRFTIDVPADRYRLRATSFGGLTCTGRVVVRAGERVRVNAVCPIP